MIWIYLSMITPNFRCCFHETIISNAYETHWTPGTKERAHAGRTTIHRRQKAVSIKGLRVGKTYRDI